MEEGPGFPLSPELTATASEVPAPAGLAATATGVALALAANIHGAALLAGIVLAQLAAIETPRTESSHNRGVSAGFDGAIAARRRSGRAPSARSLARPL